MFQFTQPAKRRGLFGSQGMSGGNSLTATPEQEGDGLGQMLAMGAPAQPTIGQVSEAPPVQAKKPGPNWGGIAASFLSGMTGQKGFYLENLQDEQERAAKAREYQQRRQDENTDWQARETWKQANIKPANNDTVNDWNFYQGLDPERRQAYLKYLDETRPIVNTGPDGRQYVQSRVSAIPSAPVGKLTPMSGGAASPAQPPFADNGGNLDQITMMAESGGNPNAVSPAGARGLMQVMPGTERDPGFGIRPGNGTEADRTRVGREYRAKMQQRYGGDLRKMWAAYNWGPGNLEAAIARYGENGWFSRAPKETRDYIARNLRAAGGS